MMDSYFVSQFSILPELILYFFISVHFEAWEFCKQFLKLVWCKLFYLSLSEKSIIEISDL